MNEIISNIISDLRYLGSVPKVYFGTLNQVKIERGKKFDYPFFVFKEANTIENETYETNFGKQETGRVIYTWQMFVFVNININNFNKDIELNQIANLNILIENFKLALENSPKITEFEIGTLKKHIRFGKTTDQGYEQYVFNEQLCGFETTIKVTKFKNLTCNNL